MRGSLCCDASFVKEHEAISDGGRLVEVMQYHSDCDVVIISETSYETQQLDLMAEIQVVCRLIEQQRRGLLSKTARKPHALDLASGKLIDVLIGEVIESCHEQCLPDVFRAFGVAAKEPIAVWMASIVDGFANRDSGRGRAMLGQECEALGECSCAEGFEGCAVERDGTALDVMESCEGSEQR